MCGTAGKSSARFVSDTISLCPRGIPKVQNADGKIDTRFFQEDFRERGIIKATCIDEFTSPVFKGSSAVPVVLPGSLKQGYNCCENCVFPQHKHGLTSKRQSKVTVLLHYGLQPPPQVTQRHQTNTTLTFPGDSVLTVGNYKTAPRALNQMSAVTLRWDRINIR